MKLPHLKYLLVPLRLLIALILTPPWWFVLMVATDPVGSGDGLRVCPNANNIVDEGVKDLWRWALYIPRNKH